MRSYSVVFTERARRGLRDLRAYIAAAAGYIDRIEASCLSLQTFPHRGARRPDGSRILGFERSATLRFVVRSGVVVIVTIAYRGRDILKETR